MSTVEGLVALVGNPNVGKSTVFNGLTGSDQHTGNWPGKTVALFEGVIHHNGRALRIVDLPGAYSLRPNSREEEVTRDFILDDNPDVVVCVLDATALERNLVLALQLIPLSRRCVVCVNLMDEAEKQGIVIDVRALERLLGVSVVATSARNGEGLEDLLEVVAGVMDGAGNGSDAGESSESGIATDRDIRLLYARAEAIAKEVVARSKTATNSLTDKIDAVVTSRRYGIPIMLAMLATVFAVTLYLANFPSQALFSAFGVLELALDRLLSVGGAPFWVKSLLVAGMYRTVAWVTAVMLPPMAIFFPLFTLLEDFGYLPRVAFNLDHLFRGSGGHGKQALTMSMGFGCNAAGVVACRIIESPRERLIAVLTNCFVPCNGRFPTLIMLATVFFAGAGIIGALLPAVVVIGAIMAGVFATFLTSRILTASVLKGAPSSFVLELPPYRKPDIWSVIRRSWKDRTVWVLKRALVVALPCGAITWAFANLEVGGMSLLARAALAFDPLASLMGLDGIILTAFILGFPANEIVIPIAMMSYLAQGAMVGAESSATVGAVLVANGWTWTTALACIIFTLLHFPCGTTLYTIFKETGSRRWTVAAALLPTAMGVVVLVLLRGFFTLVGL